MNCLYCGKRLSLLHKLAGRQYCNDEHRSLFKQDQETIGLARLIEAKRPAVSPSASPPRKKGKGTQKANANGVPPLAERFVVEFPRSQSTVRPSFPPGQQLPYEIAAAYPQPEVELSVGRLAAGPAEVPVMAPRLSVMSLALDGTRPVEFDPPVSSPKEVAAGTSVHPASLQANLGFLFSTGAHPAESPVTQTAGAAEFTTGCELPEPGELLPRRPDQLRRPGTVSMPLSATAAEAKPSLAGGGDWVFETRTAFPRLALRGTQLRGSAHVPCGAAPEPLDALAADAHPESFPVPLEVPAVVGPSAGRVIPLPSTFRVLEELTARFVDFGVKACRAAAQRLVSRPPENADPVLTPEMPSIGVARATSLGTAGIVPSSCRNKAIEAGPRVGDSSIQSAAVANRYPSLAVASGREEPSPGGRVGIPLTPLIPNAQPTPAGTRLEPPLPLLEPPPALGVHPAGQAPRTSAITVAPPAPATLGEFSDIGAEAVPEHASPAADLALPDATPAGPVQERLPARTLRTPVCTPPHITVGTPVAAPLVKPLESLATAPAPGFSPVKLPASLKLAGKLTPAPEPAPEHRLTPKAEPLPLPPPAPPVTESVEQPSILPASEVRLTVTGGHLCDLVPLQFGPLIAVDIDRRTRAMMQTFESKPRTILPQSGPALSPDDGIPSTPPPAAAPLLRKNLWMPIAAGWKAMPRTLKWSLMIVPLMAVLLSIIVDRLPEPNPAEVAGSMEQAIANRWEAFHENIVNRAAISLTDDFRTGLAAWQGKGDWASSWSYDKAGFVFPGDLALYQPSAPLSDYDFEFAGQIEQTGISWVVRAADLSNYMAVRIVITKPGPLPKAELWHYPVLGGKKGRTQRKELPFRLRNEKMYRVRMTVKGSDFTVYVDDLVGDFFEDNRLPAGGVGFFRSRGEKARLRWVSVMHQYDVLGRLCALIAPYSLDNPPRN